MERFFRRFFPRFCLRYCFNGTGFALAWLPKVKPQILKTISIFNNEKEIVFAVFDAYIGSTLETKFTTIIPQVIRIGLVICQG